MSRAVRRSRAAAHAPRRVRPLGVVRSRPLAVLVLFASLALSCGGREVAAPPVDEAGRAQLLIESGNQAFTAGDFGLAARRYAAAAVIKKDDPAAYYGLGMALSKLGRDEEARAAYAHARALARP